MSSTNYYVQWESLSVGSSDTQSSASYTLRSSFAQDSGSLGATSSSYTLESGFRPGVYDPVVAFQLFTQDVSSQVAATALVGTTVTVTSVSGFAVNDRVLVVQNEGESQVTAMGKVSSIGASTLVLDALSGGSPGIDGSGGDYVYKMTADGTSISMATPAVSTVTTGVIGWEATADTYYGYSVYVLEDDDLETSGDDTIADVTDGSVTPGSSEYGARSSDSSLSGSTFDTQESAITTSPQLVASRSSMTFSERDLLTLKLAISTGAEEGAYSHTVSLIFTGNY